MSSHAFIPFVWLSSIGEIAAGSFDWFSALIVSVFTSTVSVDTWGGISVVSVEIEDVITDAGEDVEDGFVDSTFCLQSVVPLIEDS